MRTYSRVYGDTGQCEILERRITWSYHHKADSIDLSCYGERYWETGSIADRSRSALSLIHSYFYCSLHKFSIAHACAVDTDVVETGSVGSVNTTSKKVKPVASQTSVDVKDVVEEEAGCDSVLPCDPRQWLHRYFMLGFMCMLSFGSYYVYDNPTALQRTIMNVSFQIVINLAFSSSN